MSRDVSHTEAMELLPEAALDALPPDDQAGVVAHATGCPECGPALIALRNAVAEMAFATPSVTVDPVRRARVRTRLMARARADLSIAELTPVAGEMAGPVSGASGTGRAPRSGHGMGRGGARRRGAAPRRSWGNGGGGIRVGTRDRGGARAGGGGAPGRCPDDQFFTGERRALLAWWTRCATPWNRASDSFVRSVTGQHTRRRCSSHRVRCARRGRGCFWDHATNKWTPLVARDLPGCRSRGPHVSTVGSRDAQGEDQRRDQFHSRGRMVRPKCRRPTRSRRIRLPRSP